MIKQLKTFKTNTLAFEVLDRFTETDEKLAQKLFKEKLDSGFDKVNVLLKFDEMKISAKETKVFFEDAIFLMKQLNHLGNMALVGHSKMMKALVPIDNFFFERLQKGSKERYFDVSQMDDAYKFVTETKF